MQHDNLPAAMSVNVAARYIGISRANLYRLLKSGELKFAKIGSRTLVRRVDADRFLATAVANSSASAGIWE